METATATAAAAHQLMSLIFIIAAVAIVITVVIVCNNSKKSASGVKWSVPSARDMGDSNFGFKFSIQNLKLGLKFRHKFQS